MQRENEGVLQLSEKQRTILWQRLGERIEQYLREVPDIPVAQTPSVLAIRTLLSSFDFRKPGDPLEAIEFAFEELRRTQVHTPHPRYFGLFNPAPTTMGIVADAIVAALNPQLAAWTHNPLASEIERHLVQTFGVRFGWTPPNIDGVFCTAGAEANHTAVLTSLCKTFPDFRTSGLRGLPKQPVLYVSGEGHHSILKAARLCGLGTAAVREVGVDESLRLDVGALEKTIAEDRAQGFAPLLVVGTAGTTSAGIVDPLRPIAHLAEREGLWFHADAAWGGAAALVPELRHVLDGIERADSITFDAHKWLSVPMGAGIYLTRHPEILTQTFSTAAGYMPGSQAGAIDPYSHSIQWSRRFTGLKVFLSLAVAGWPGYEAVLRRQVQMGQLLADKLRSAGWQIVNDTPLPLVCFVDQRSERGQSAEYLQSIADQVVSSGRAWISVCRIAKGRSAIRACITNYRTVPSDLDELVAALEAARQAEASRKSPRL